MASEDRRPPIPPDMVKRVKARAGYVCQKCGSDDRCEVDHVVPWHIVKVHDEDNLMLLCLPCNRSKGGKVEADGRKTWFDADFFGATA
ncbi:HNH endonuclease [Rhodococcus sp. EPR-157]|uniref:HNH endonuclease n=1 Tax=Rhodococcus sp. EPR-157 TaxID=1813677 RepID=UPI0009ED11F4|nr:HNH endonuclease signature motif containing protein [Rhodococcus sp. EPR-157]